MQSLSLHNGGIHTNSNLKMIDIPTSQLSLLLPQKLIEDVLGYQNHDLSPSSPHIISTSIQSSPSSVSKSSFPPSPQIAPLESRLHSYLFKHPHKGSVSLKLATLFENLNLEKEVEKEIAECKQEVKLCNEIKTDFFDGVVATINLFAKKPEKLNARAKIFCPLEIDKENIPPQWINDKRN
ncbi:unnamed protein product [Blepharisma stoltei]|uniref:Uncharacterized protein n=1 Tax=Blepharisma stoltei TaxID=1481888 RepID=A0AAU9JM43_9CILI|nr:unnamed protein product [Blepharisma stoltei]